MRVTILSLAVIAAGLLGATQTASAQSSYNYPWCTVSFEEGGSGGPGCSYLTREQCMGQDIRQLGNCYPNPEYKPLPGGLPPPVVDRTARTVYSYKYCLIRSADGTIDCYFDTLEFCLAEASGITGNCYPNPHYRGPTAAVAPRAQVAATKKRSINRSDR